MRKLAVIGIILVASCWAQPQSQPYEAKDYSYLIGMKGFGDQTLKNHFKLYQGYVKNTNLLLSILQNDLEQGRFHAPQFGALQRRLGWEWDGMRLHEFYFENLGGNGKLDPQSPLHKAIINHFGSYEAWEKDYKATGVIRGIGWVILYQDPKTKKMMNLWINEHDTGHLAGGTPILIMDVWEHAYMLDYGLDRAAYINAFFENIDWDVANARYEGLSSKGG